MTDNRALNQNEQHELLQQLADATSASLPLPDGLRAAQAETSSKRLRSTLGRLANALESGQREQLPDLPGVPAHIVGLLRAGVATDRTGDSLHQLVEHYRLRRELRAQFWGALAYPLVICALACLTLGILGAILTEPTRVMLEFQDELAFQNSSSDWTRWMFHQWQWVHRDAIPLVRNVLLTTAGVCLAVRWLGGAAKWERVLARFPLFGPLVTWSGLTEFSWLLSSLLRHRVPLPEALAYTAQGLYSRNMAELAEWLARQVQTGASLSTLMQSTPRVPEVVVPFLSWGEQHECLAEAVDAIYDMSQRRVALRARLVTAVLVPALLLLAGGLLMTLLAAAVAPLISLLTVLSNLM